MQFYKIWKVSNGGISKFLPCRDFAKHLSTFSSKSLHTDANKAEVKDDTEPSTHFGFETVPESEKKNKVHKVFEEVASSYDRMNDAMSFGVHRIWKDIFIERLSPTWQTSLLDMAGGTGDIAFRYIKYLENQKRPESMVDKIHVTISDINQNMLDVGKKRAETLSIPKQDSFDLNWVCANAESLPFDEAKYSAYTIAFGIRNVTHIDKVLKEAYRVLKPGGRFMCLEFSHVNNATLKWLYDQYSFQVIPPMGQIIAGQWQPYQYLVESIRKFPKQDDFKSMIEEAGFKLVTYENLSQGVCCIHSGFKI